MGEYEYEEVGKKPKEDKDPPLSYFELYKFSSTSEKLLLALGVVCAVISAMSEAIFLFFYGKCLGVISNFDNDWASATTDDERQQVQEIYTQNVNEFAVTIVIFLGIIFANIFIATFIFNYTAMRQTYRIRQLYFSRILNQDISWHDQSSTGDFASRMADDLVKVQDGINDKAIMVLYYFVVGVTSLIQGLIVGWKLSLAGLVLFPMSFVLMIYIGKLTTKMAMNEAEAYGNAGKIADETLTYIKTVVAFDGQNRELERYKKWLLIAKKSSVKKHLLSGLLEGVVEFFIYFASSIFVWYGAKLIIDDMSIDGGYDVTKYTTVYYSILTITSCVGATMPSLQGFNRAKGAAHHIFSVIDKQPVINKSYNEGETVKKLHGNITFQDVCFSYPTRKDVPVLQNLNLKIKSGETVALVGSSGCGKSTIIQLIQRFYDPTHGNIYVDEKKVTDLNLVSLRSHIGMVGQEPVLFNGTISENIRLGNLEAGQIEIEEAAKKANAHAFILSFSKGYQTLVGERGTQLSGGQKQRIAIARALVRQPTILLLDEATSALDSNSEAVVQTTIDAISRECTTVIVAHRLSSIQKADRILVIEKGKIVEEGNHDDLMLLEGAYHNLVVSQLSTSDGGDDVKHSTSEIKDELNVYQNSDVKDEEGEEKPMDMNLNFGAFWRIMKTNLVPGWCVMCGCIFYVIAALTGMVFAVLMGRSFTAMADPDPDQIAYNANIYGTSYIVLSLILLFSYILRIYFVGVAGENMIVNLRCSMFQTMTLQKLEWFDRSENGVGSLSARLSGEPSNIQNAISMCVRPFINTVIMYIFLICIGIYWCWKLLLAILAYIPVFIILMHLGQKVLVKENQKSGEVLNGSTKLAVEGITNIRTVASLTIEKYFQRCYDSKLQSGRKLLVLSYYMQSAIASFGKCTLMLQYLVTMFYGAHLIKTQEITAAGVISLSLMFSFCLWQSLMTLQVLTNLVGCFVACTKISNLLDLFPKGKQSGGGQNMVVPGGDIDYQDVSFRYPTRPDAKILNGLDLKVFRGKTVALVGPSGCGKSTVVQLLMRFYNENSGQIVFGEDDIDRLDLKALRYRLAIVMQEPCVFNKTIGENIAYGLSGRSVSQDEIIEAAKKANIHSFITSLPLGYDTELGEKGTQLSGGQKQRLAIARAIIRNPEVLILDEATSALDAESEKIVQEALNNAREERTCLVIAHRLATVVDSDMIAVIDNGRVAEFGMHPELMKKKGLYWELHNAHVQS